VKYEKYKSISIFILLIISKRNGMDSLETLIIRAPMPIGAASSPVRPTLVITQLQLLWLQLGFYVNPLFGN